MRKLCVSESDIFKPGRKLFEGLDLHHANLAGADLTSATFTNVNLRGGSLVGAQLDNSTFVECDLKGADLRDCSLSGLTLQTCDASESNWIGCSVLRVKFQGLNLARSNFARASFVDAELIDSSLVGADLSHTNWSHTQVERTDWSDVRAPNIALNSCSLLVLRAHRADFSGAHLVNVRMPDIDLFHSCLRGAVLDRVSGIRAVLEFADFSNSHWKHCDCSYSSFVAAILEQASMSGCVLDHCDFYWCDSSEFFFSGCQVKEVRWQNPVKIAFGGPTQPESIRPRLGRITGIPT